VTLFNVAVSSSVAIVSMTVPSYENSPLNNYYQANISSAGEYRIPCFPLNVIPIPGVMRLVRIDAEGLDLQVLLGMGSLLQRDRAFLIVAGSRTTPLARCLVERGYSILNSILNAIGSPNIIAEPLDRLEPQCRPTPQDSTAT